jgi:nucleoside-diphosphate-sugar epimerase
MKVLVTGASGYIGSAVAKALIARGHKVFGLARSDASASKLRSLGVTPVSGDFADHSSLTRAIATSNPDAVISTASVGTIGGNAKTFAKDRDAVGALLSALGKSNRALIFTSGSAVVGVFNGGNKSDVLYNEDCVLPLPSATFAPPSAGIHPMLVDGFGAAMAARIETEKAVLGATGVAGIVVRPGLVYGNGGSSDLPALISMARANGRAPHLGSGGTCQSYIHIDELADLFCLAIEQTPKGAMLHGVIDEVCQRDLALSISRMIGAGDHSESFTMNQMMGMTAGARIGLSLTKHISPNRLRVLQNAWAPPASVAAGISLSLNKRLSSEKTQQLLSWSPVRKDILRDLEFGSYAR